MYQFFKPNLTLAVNTYNARRFPCNDGWCQDILDAAMLGLTNDAKSMVFFVFLFFCFLFESLGCLKHNIEKKHK